MQVPPFVLLNVLPNPPSLKLMNPFYAARKTADAKAQSSKEKRIQRNLFPSISLPLFANLCSLCAFASKQARLRNKHYQFAAHNGGAVTVVGSVPLY